MSVRVGVLQQGISQGDALRERKRGVTKRGWYFVGVVFVFCVLPRRSAKHVLVRVTIRWIKHQIHHSPSESRRTTSATAIITGHDNTKPLPPKKIRKKQKTRSVERTEKADRSKSGAEHCSNETGTGTTITTTTTKTTHTDSNTNRRSDYKNHTKPTPTPTAAAPHLSDTDEDLEVHAERKHRVPQLDRLLQGGNAGVQAHHQREGVDVGRQELALEVVEQHGVDHAQHPVHQGAAGVHAVQVRRHVPVLRVAGAKTAVVCFMLWGWVRFTIWRTAWFVSTEINVQLEVN